MIPTNGVYSYRCLIFISFASSHLHSSNSAPVAHPSQANGDKASSTRRSTLMRTWRPSNASPMLFKTLVRPLSTLAMVNSAVRKVIRRNDSKYFHVCFVGSLACFANHCAPCLTKKDRIFVLLLPYTSNDTYFSPHPYSNLQASHFSQMPVLSSSVRT